MAKLGELVKEVAEMTSFLDSPEGRRLHSADRSSLFEVRQTLIEKLNQFEEDIKNGN